MVSRAVIIVSVILVAFGCVHPKANVQPVVSQVTAPFEQFVAKNFDWSTVQRIVLMPPANQTAFPRVADEIQNNLATEIQRAGRFEIVVANREDVGARASDVFTSGQFNEMEVLRVAREYQADAVLFANVTQYHPYAPPRVGLSLLLVSPAEGIAIASTTGVWDAREANTSLQAQNYFKQTQLWPRSLLGTDRMNESPDVFQRFVCHQIAASFYPTPGSASFTSGAAIPVAEAIPIEGPPSIPVTLPPVPPASMP